MRKLCPFVLSFVLIYTPVYGLTVADDREGYIEYENWLSCKNSSIQFDFNTRKRDSMLLYTDDGARKDFFYLYLKNGKLFLDFKIADDQSKISSGSELNDGRFHTVKIVRHRYELQLIVDSRIKSYPFSSSPRQLEKSTAFIIFFVAGFDPSYKNLYKQNSLAKKDAVFMERFAGKIMNVMFYSCSSCLPRRPRVINQRGVVGVRESCLIKNQCRDSCICFSMENSMHRCDCSNRHCKSGANHYRLPFDEFRRDHSSEIDSYVISNPSGLDSRYFGAEVSKTPGFSKSGLNLNCRDAYVRISGALSRDECLGNLNLCSRGFTLGFWLIVHKTPNSKLVFMSNGGHSSSSHGIAVYFEDDTIFVQARTLTGKYWIAKSRDYIKHRWTYVTITWRNDRGLSLYLNGQLKDKRSWFADVSVVETPTKTDINDELLLGRPNDNSWTRTECDISIDEFEFYSEEKDKTFIQENGPVYKYFCPFSKIANRELVGGNLRGVLNYQTALPEIKLHDGFYKLLLRYRSNFKQYIDFGKFENSCLSDLSRCKYGATLRIYVRSIDVLRPHSCFVDGGARWFRICVNEKNALSTTAYVGDKKYSALWNGIQSDVEYKLLASFSPSEGLQVYANNKLVANDNAPKIIQEAAPIGHLLVGRRNKPSDNFAYMTAYFRSLDIWLASRKHLINIGILKGDGYHILIPFENPIQTSRYIDVEAPKSCIAKGIYNTESKDCRIGNCLKVQQIGEYAKATNYVGCLRDLESCKKGFTISTWVMPITLKDDQVFISSPHFLLFYKNGKLRADVHGKRDSWTISSDALVTGKWQHVHVTWNKLEGLNLWIDGLRAHKRRDHQSQYTSRVFENHKMYFGKPGQGHGSLPGLKTMDAKMDEFEYWSNQIIRDPLNFEYEIIDLRNKTGEKEISGERRTVSCHTKRNSVVIQNKRGHPSLVQKGSYNEYLNFGHNFIPCTCENCPRGFTIKIELLTSSLKNNATLISSPMLDMWWYKQKLFAKVRHNKKIWETFGKFSDENPNWREVVLSWSEYDGLILSSDNVVIGVGELSREMTNEKDKFGIMEEDKCHIRGFFLMGKSHNSDFPSHGTHYFDYNGKNVTVWGVRKRFITDGGEIKPVPVTTTTAPTTTPTIATTQYLPTRETYFNDDYWVLYNISGMKPNYENDGEKVTLVFKTKKRDGLLFYSGFHGRNVQIVLKNGYPSLQVFEGRKRQRIELTQIPSKIYDNQWHTIRLLKKGGYFTVFIDNTEFPYVLQYNYPLLWEKGYVLLGGEADAGKVSEKFVDTNFQGYIKTALFDNKYGYWIDLLNLLNEPTPKYVIPYGKLPNADWNSGRPITLIGSGFGFEFKAWKAQKGDKLKLTFKTLENKAVLIYQTGDSSNYLLIEIYDEKLWLVIKEKSRLTRLLFSERRISDGNVHNITLEKKSNQLFYTLDFERKQVNYPSRMNLVNSLHVAPGINIELPRESWAKGKSNRRFVGCLMQLKLSKEIGIDLNKAATKQRLTGIKENCTALRKACENNPCFKGTCSEVTSEESTRKYKCDCIATGYSGPKCEDKADILCLQGNIEVSYARSDYKLVPTNDLGFRFKSFQRDSFILSALNDNSEIISIRVVSASLKLNFNINGQQKEVNIGENLVDNRWHSLVIRRRSNKFYVKLDDNSQVTTVGGFQEESGLLNIRKLKIGMNGEKDSFIGYISSLYFDGQDILESLKTEGQIRKFLSKDQCPLPYKPVTFSARKRSFAQINSPLKGHLTFNFKTEFGNGLLYYQPGSLEDSFLGLELYEGQLYIVGRNKEGVTKTRLGTLSKYSDNQWHSVILKKRRRGDWTVKIDDYTEIFDRKIPFSNHLYIGGVQEYVKIPPEFKSQQGFEGCISGVQLDGEHIDLFTSTIKKNIERGCHKLGSIFCSKPGICKNGGICYDGLTSFICDCNMTGWAGKQCSEEPLGYRIGKYNKRGIVFYKFDEPIDTIKDTVAFGFMTWYENGTLFRADSTDNGDFIRIFMEKGYLKAEYNLGTEKSSIITINREKLNDGKYHVVKFIRHLNSRNATLTVDDYPSASFKSNKFAHTKELNRLQILKIGGNLRSNGEIYETFNGIIAGVYYQGVRAGSSGGAIGGIRIIDLGRKAIRDIRVSVKDDVTPAPHPFRLPKPVIPILPPREFTDGRALAAGSERPRAGAVAGAFLGILLAASSIMWAVYKLKPGKILLGKIKESKGDSQMAQTESLLNDLEAMDSAKAPPTAQRLTTTTTTDSKTRYAMQTMSPGAVSSPGLMAAEQIHVDCMQITRDGKHVVTGSMNSPPLIWDLKTGALVRSLQGEEVSSTDLHLAAGDSLIVGQVAEYTSLDPVDGTMSGNLLSRKFQIWDISSGTPLSMPSPNEACTATALLSDGETAVLGRTEKFGGGTTLVMWDIAGNQSLRSMNYTGSMGAADPVTHLYVTKDDRFVAAAFTNSYDAMTNFVIFDLSASDEDGTKVLSLHANADCTAVLDNQEAVTGTKDGKLVVWSFRTGKTLRQVSSPLENSTLGRSAGLTESRAHDDEVSAVVVDHGVIVSASHDHTLKVWDLETEKLLHTLNGHTDQVWCCTISSDGDWIVSGGRDGTVRLWKLATGNPICFWKCAVDVFSVKLSPDKQVLCALGDKFGARKLVLLRVVHTRTISRSTTPAAFV
ncbi:DgyrCDS14032 [Dimorphilus gyrociliatus]|uniref:DgyrCDS14032 n=1 Tax=Dimorphilus gyrociliatus TaxID=2664684 RepID=A0A7I8WCL7_9ANNE|nr:DgyrCDS14032 [Dimorphilus gyrociliatus]